MTEGIRSAETLWLKMLQNSKGNKRLGLRGPFHAWRSLYEARTEFLQRTRPVFLHRNSPCCSVIPSLFICAIFLSSKHAYFNDWLSELKGPATLTLSKTHKNWKIKSPLWFSSAYNKNPINVLFRKPEIAESRRRKWVKTVLGLIVPFLLKQNVGQNM